MNKKAFPSISVLIPTLNADKVLEECLVSIVKQNYPKSKIEIVIADGGSTDRTLKIAEKYGARVYKNRLKTGEAGKAVALKKAKNELVALIDSDNILPDKNWFKKMVEPFYDPEIVGSEPWKFTYRKKDGFIDRYCALLGMNDPLCYFLGNYDRLNVLTGKWTSLPVEQKDKESWLKIALRTGAIPTIGANGTIFRREFLINSGLVKNYLFDIDVLAQLVEEKSVKFAKVKIGIVHLYCGSDIGKFVRKQKRRIRDYLYYQKIGVRNYPWQKQDKSGVAKFILSCLLIFPLIYQALKGFYKKPDIAWLFHPLACWITFWTYGWGKILGFFKSQEMDRKGWKQ